MRKAKFKRNDAIFMLRIDLFMYCHVIGHITLQVLRSFFILSLFVLEWSEVRELTWLEEEGEKG